MREAPHSSGTGRRRARGLVHGMHGESDLAARALASFVGGAAFQEAVGVGDVGQRQHGADHRPEFALVDQTAEGPPVSPGRD
ncbi:hypothetical protein STENM327S_00592 [Streptomyces tendae]